MRTTNEDGVPLLPEIADRLRIIDQLGSEAARAYLAGRTATAVANRALLNSQSDIVGRLLL